MAYSIKIEWEKCINFINNACVLFFALSGTKNTGDPFYDELCQYTSLIPPCTALDCSEWN